MDVYEAESLDNYEFAATKVNESDQYLQFYFNFGQSKEYFDLKLDPFRQLVTIRYKFLPQFVSYMYLKTRVYGWFYADQYYSPLNGLFQIDFILFSRKMIKVPQKWTEKFRDIDAQTEGQVAADAEILEDRRRKKEKLENKKNDLRKKIKLYKDE